jgi:hypothetical protein
MATEHEYKWLARLDVQISMRHDWVRNNGNP